MLSLVVLLQFIFCLSSQFVVDVVAAAATGAAAASSSSERTAVFVNFHSEDVAVFWQDVKDEENLIQIGSLKPFGSIRLNTFIGQKFVYKMNGGTKVVTVEGNNSSSSSSVFTIGPTELLVQCSTTEGVINAHIVPEMAPYGAARFLELVTIGYYNGCALNRVIPKFLTQFGISKDYETRTKWRMNNIPDDYATKSGSSKFQPGYLSYAGSGKDSRSTEVFIVMPGTSQRQLDYFGTNSWETPFGYVEMDDVNDVVARWHPYGDIPPYGTGPDPQRIYQKDGYEYLKEEFPQMSYIQTCSVIDSFTKYSDEEEQEEL